MVLRAYCIYGDWRHPAPGDAYLTTKRLLWTPLKLGWLITLQKSPRSFEFDLLDIRDVVTDHFSIWTRLRLLVGKEVHVLSLTSDWLSWDAYKVASKWKHQIETLARTASEQSAEGP